MQHRDFVYWLQGYFELTPDGPLTAEQAKVIKEHLALVFEHQERPVPAPTASPPTKDAYEGLRRLLERRPAEPLYPNASGTGMPDDILRFIPHNAQTRTIC